MKMVTIKSARVIELMRDACKLAGDTQKMLEEAIKPGISTYELDRLAEEFIRKNGGIPAEKNYPSGDRNIPNFPASICASVNDEVIHGIPSKKVILKEGDIVSIDLVAEKNGFNGDCARTFTVGKVSSEAQKLIDVTKQSFFEGIKYVLPILHPNKKRLALIMCPEEDSASVEWARQKDENWVNKDITSLEFVENIFRLMNWNRECRYKVLGRVANSDQGLCMLFNLEEAIMFTPKPQEYTDPLTGEMKKKQMKFFPDTYKNCIGKSYNDYIADHQMNMFEDFIGYQGSAVLDEPVPGEDAVSKESMPQESEISENIMLPDLAKQSENIEQQSGEIAERGMPT